MAKDEFKVAFGRRLRLIARERGFDTTEEIARFVGATRAAVDTWLNGRALPKWEQAAKLASAWQVTLDWLATGKPDGLPHATYIRLTALDRGMELVDGAADAPASGGAWAPVSTATTPASKAKKAVAQASVRSNS